MESKRNREIKIHEVWITTDCKVIGWDSLLYKSPSKLTAAEVCNSSFTLVQTSVK